MSKKENTKKVIIAAMGSGNPYVNEWMMFEVLDSSTAMNMVKILQPVQETIVNGQNGPIKQKVLGSFEFYIDEFFSDDKKFMYHTDYQFAREIEESEDLYKGYFSVIAARKKQQIEQEAKRKIQAVENQPAQNN